MNLHTAGITRLTDDTAREIVTAADGDRLVYARGELDLDHGEPGPYDLMVADAGQTPVEPYRLAQGVFFPSISSVPVTEPKEHVSLRGDLMAVSFNDGHDGEIGWAMWTEDAGGDGSGDDGTDGGTDGDDTTDEVTFPDVAGSPYETAILNLAERGIIAGREDGTFGPLDTVSRQQFAKMIVKALGFTVSGTEVCPFVDVAGQIGSDPFYPAKYVAVCAERGITTGTSPTTFSPTGKITHQQLITMLARAADLPEPPTSYVPSFTASQFSLAEHYQNAGKAAYAGLLDGLVGVGPSYSFLAPSTRGECAQLLYNLLQME
jgi:hypothetical protein